MPSLSPLSSLETKLFHSIAEMFFAFFSQKNSLSKTFLVECLRSGAASCIKRREFWREIHTPLWLLIGRIIFFFFSRVKTILRSSDWLELICVRKFTT